MKTVTIVGAGITGPTAALTLARAGYAVTVLEQRPADALHSTGILGITHRNWNRLTRAGVHLANGELQGNIYRDVVAGESARSPFRLIVWTDLHNAITSAAMAAGAEFAFAMPAVHPDHVMGDYMIDAGGIVSAARRHLPSEYIGSFIYRGISTLPTSENFTTYKLPGKRGFLDLGQTNAGSAAWAFGVRRPRPAHFATTFTTECPAESQELPDEFRRIVQSTPMMMVLPQSSWSVAPSMHDDGWRRFTLGDANGPVRPITTSGANLGIQAGLAARVILSGSDAMTRELLARRDYALALGLRLRGPEIGGYVEDPEFGANQVAMYGETP